jgi:hypothetical protein
MASPHTAGIVALLWPGYPTLQRDIVNTERKLRPATVILNGVQGCGGDGPRKHPNNEFGSGRADAFRAINEFNIYTNQANYVAGDAFQTFISLVRRQMTPLTADLYLGIVTPPMNVSLIPLGTQTIPGGTKAFDIPLTSGPFAGAPSGSYAWFSLMVPPGADPSNPANHLSVDAAVFHVP